MTTLSLPPAAPVDPAPLRIPLHLFVAYEDQESGRRAMELVQRLGHTTHDNTDLLSVFWRVDMLNHDSSPGDATDEAGRADIFVLGLSRGNSFHRLSTWLNQTFMAHRGGSTAIVAVVPDGFDQEAEGKGCLAALSDIASRFGATFLFTGPRQSHAWAPATPACPLLTS